MCTSGGVRRGRGRIDDSIPISSVRLSHIFIIPNNLVSELIQMYILEVNELFSYVMNHLKAT